MTYGKSKERDMVRSILPSSSRKGARDNKRNVNQARRSAVRQALRQHRDVLAAEASTDFDLIEAEERIFTDTFGGDTISGDIVGAWDPASEQDVPYTKISEADAWYERRIKEVMWDRREADKVAPFQRWAVAQTKDMRKLDRATWLQAKMPDTLAVRHAMSHVTYLEEFDVEPNPYRLRYRYMGGAGEWMRAVRYAHAVEMLYKVCNGPLKRYNRLHTRFHTRTVNYGTGQDPKETLEGGWKLSGYEDERVRARWNSNYIIRRRVATYVKEVEPLLGVHDIHDYICRYTDGMYARDSWTSFEFKLASTFEGYEPLDTLSGMRWLGIF